jgi:hypothetical protein
MRNGTSALLGLLLSALPAFSQGLDFAPTELPWAVVDEAYSPPLLMIAGGKRCDPGDVSFTASGNVPEGLAITGMGQLEGVPRKAGTYHFQIRVANACSARVRDVMLIVTGAPILVVSVSILEFRYPRDGPAPEPQALLVRSTWPDLAYSIDSHDVAWLRATPTRGRVPRIGAAVDADRVKVTVERGSLVPGVYEAVLTFWTRQGANAPAVKVRLTIE